MSECDVLVHRIMSSLSGRFDNKPIADLRIVHSYQLQMFEVMWGTQMLGRDSNLRGALIEASTIVNNGKRQTHTGKAPLFYEGEA